MIEPSIQPKRNTHVAIYVNRRRRNTSGILHEELHRKVNVEDSDNAPWQLVVDGEKRTPRQLLSGTLPESIMRVWHGARRTDCFAVYRREVDGSVVFDTDLHRDCGRGFAFEPLAVFVTAAEIRHERPFGSESVLDSDLGKWTAEQVLRGESPASALWRKPKL